MTRPTTDRDIEAVALSDVRRRHHRDAQIKFLTIAQVAEILQVATRTVRRRIAAGELVAHRSGGVVRIAEADLRAFLAVHREA
jgi:excisionase family DNA binding protein